MNAARRFSRKPIAMISLGFVLVVIFACVFAGALSPFDPIAQDLTSANALPSTAHWLGTDTLGRDLLSRLLHGGQSTLLGALVGVAVFTILGVPLGLGAGYWRGALDAVSTRVVELLFAVPTMVILLVVLAVFSSNTTAAMVTLGILGFGSLFRVVRGSTIAASGELYVTAARASGLRSSKVIAFHILPNLLGPVVVQVTLFAASAIIVESGLAFLGFSVAPPAPSWGSMVGDASQNLSSYPWQLVPSGGTIALVVLALGLVGDGVRDALSRDDTTRSIAATAAEIPAREIPAETADTLLSVRDLAVAFGPRDTPTVVLRNVSFDVHQGDALGIVGESGSGKSVTARAILGLLGGGGRIVSGTISYRGREIASSKRSAFSGLRGNEIAFIPQEPVNTLDPVFTVGSQIREVVRKHDRVSRKQAAERVLELLELVEIADPVNVAGRYAHELSGGMAQRVGIALALAARPKLIVADEPTTALDVTVQQEILDLLVELRARFGTAIVLVTHDWGVLADLCDSAIVMYAGEIVEQASIEQLYRHPLHPYTRALIAANPHSVRPGEPLPSIPGQVPDPSEWPTGCHFADRCPLATAACRAAPIPLMRPDASRESRCIRVGELEAAS